MQLVGTELGRDFAINKHGLKSKYRILPKEFGEYGEEKIFEIEKICVATNTMDYQGYLNCRNYSFILKLLGHAIFFPINKLTQKLGISWFDFSKTLTSVLEKGDFKGKFKDLYDDFCKESRDELFETKDEAIKFYANTKNYKLLLSGEAGENLHAKYQAKSFLILDDIFTTIFYVLKKKFNKEYDGETESILNSSEKWLKNLYLIDAIIEEKKKPKKDKYKLNIDFDFPEWLKKNDLPLNKFKKNTTYQLNYDFKKINYIRNEIKTVQGDKERALGRYLDRRHMIGFDLFEKHFVRLD